VRPGQLDKREVKAKKATLDQTNPPPWLLLSLPLRLLPLPPPQLNCRLETQLSRSL
jgi:hypothetical protein